MALIGKVVSVTGVAYVIAQDGARREIQLGDQIETGDTIQTPRGTEVELELTNGRLINIYSEQTVQFTEELSEAILPSDLDSAVNLATIETVIKAIEEGKDINAVLEETAAGASGNYNSYGFNFVDLFRINDILNAFNFAYAYDVSDRVDIDPLIDGNDINYLGVIDGGGSISGPVTPSNSAPTALNTSASGLQNSSSIPITLSGTDVDGTVSSITLTSLPSNGSLYTDSSLTTPVVANSAYSGDSATFYFVPNNNYFGNTNFTYTVTDNLGASDASDATATITVTPINSAPDAVDNTVAATEDTAATIATGTLLANDTDIDGDSLTFVSVQAPTNGTVSLVGGNVIFTPNANYNGPATFTYTIRDAAGLTDTATVTLNVAPQNDAPVNTVPGLQTTPEDTPRVFSTGNSNAITVADIDSNTLTTTITVTNGRFNALAFAGATITNNGTGTVTITGSAAAINGALNGSSYTNTADYNGSATITVATNDGFITDTDVINVTVTPVVDIVNDSLTINEDTPISFNPIIGTNGASADSFEGLNPQINQINGVNITAGGPAVAVTNGSVTLAAGNILTFTPAPNFNGAVPTFTYRVGSGGVNETGNINITVLAVNDAPIGNADNYTVVEGTTTLQASVLTNDTDVENSPLTVGLFATNIAGNGTQTANGSNTVTTALGGTVVMNANGTFTYTAPARNHADAISDVDSFAYKPNDGSINSTAWTTVNITITDTNPMAINDVDSVGIGSTVNGNVITGAGGVSADALNVDGPHSLTNVVLTQGTFVSTNFNSTTNVRTIVTNNGTLSIDLDDGSYTYTAGVVPIVVNNPTSVASFTSAGIGLFGFQTSEPYNTTGNINSGLNIANFTGALGTTNAGYAVFRENTGEADDGVGVYQGLGALSTNNNNRIENGEQLVLSVGSTKSANIRLSAIDAGELARWEIYAANGDYISGGTTPGVAGGVTNLSISSGVAFGYVVLRSTANGTHFRLDGITVIPEPSAVPDVFTYTLTDSDGDTSNATLTMNYDSTTTAFNDTATVFEAGINQNGAQNAGTLESQPIETATGNILANDTGVSSFTNITNVNGINPDGNGVITISDARGTVQIYTQDFNGFVKGDYVVNLTGRTTEGVNDNIVLNYQLENSVSGELDNATLTVNIVDDVPIAESSITEIAVVPQPEFDLFFMIDVSGSMTNAAASGDQRLVDADGNATIVSSTGAGGNATNMTGGTAIGSNAFGTSTLAQTRDAIKAVISKYFDESTNVSVKLGIFSTGARTDNIEYTTKASALAAVDALTNITGGTNYSAGLTALQGMFGTIANPNDGVSRVAYFITDGVPTITGAGNVYIGGAAPVSVTTDPVNPAGSTGYQAFIANNNIESYAVAVGAAVPTTSALNNAHSVDADASDIESGAADNGKDLPLVVSDINTLTQVLTATVPEAFGGNIGGAGGGSSVRIGADGGFTQFIELLLDSADPDTNPDTLVRFTFDGTQISNNNNAIAGTTFTGNTLTLNTSNGFTKGQLIFDFTTGDYTYVPQGSVVVGEEIRIAFRVIDGDGDFADATNTIRIVDGKPIAVSDFDTMVASTGAANTKFFEGNVLNGIGTDGGGSQISGFRTGADGEDYIIDGADVSSIVFKGVTFNLTTVSSGNVAGGNFTINAGGELTWTSTTEPANVLVFHRDGYYKYTPPAAQVASLPQDGTQTANLTSVGNATAQGITLSGYSRTANLNNAPDTTVVYTGNGAGVAGSGDNRLNNLENLEIRFDADDHPQGVQNVTIRVNAANSQLGNNNNGGIGALQYSIYDIAGNLLGQFASEQEGVITIPSGFSNIGRILIQANSSTTGGTGTVGGVAYIDQVTFNSINLAATANVPDEVIQYTITDKDTLTTPDSSTASLTLRVVTNQYVGDDTANTINGSAGNDLITGLDGDDILNGLAGSDIIRGGAGNDTIDGGADDDQLYGGDGNDTILGGTGNDYIYGEAGNDNLQGGDGNDIIFGGSGNDTINGGAGADIISGGAGNDILTGGTGADIFKWELADRGAKGSPALDTITDFDPAAFGAGGDALDLRDILTGENHNVGVGNLADYLHFEKSGSNTVIHISSNGEFATGFNPTKDVQRITLTNVDLVQSFTDDQAIIADLLANQKLITD